MSPYDIGELDDKSPVVSLVWKLSPAWAEFEEMKCGVSRKDARATSQVSMANEAPPAKINCGTLTQVKLIRSLISNSG